MTVAVIFWRIRAMTNNRDDILVDASPREPLKPQPTTTALVVETRPRVKVTETVDFSSLLCINRVTKEKLTVCYYEKINYEDENNDGKSTTINYDGGEWWGKVKMMRNGDECWYRYDDLMVVNENVVRLWDANGIRNSD